MPPRLSTCSRNGTPMHQVKGGPVIAARTAPIIQLTGAASHLRRTGMEKVLAVDEKEGIEDEEGETRRYCVECCLGKGYAHYKEEKGERVLTFFEKSNHSSEDCLVSRAWAIEFSSE